MNQLTKRKEGKGSKAVKQEVKRKSSLPGEQEATLECVCAAVIWFLEASCYALKVDIIKQTHT